ncbi:MAG: hypothetical protein NTW19_11545 [Planctomycetota bacterium]|nr:hypothetical protein [Planctomycetota bacterium]
MLKTHPLAKAAFALALLALLPSAASAADDWKHVTVAEGLPGNETQFLKNDAAGGYWVGTLAGLGRVVGDKIEKTPVKGEAWDVLRVDATHYWVGTGGGAALVEGEKVTPFMRGGIVTPIVPFHDKTCLSLSKDRGTETSTLMHFDGSDWKPVPALKGKNAVDLIRLADGKVWVSVEGDGLAVFDPAKGLAAPTRHLESQNVTTVAQDSSGRVWCGLWQRGVTVFDGKAWTNHLANQSIYALSIRQDKAGAVWVATDKAGLWRYDGKAWTNDLKDEGPITLIEPTSDGKMWISSQSVGGLRYFDGKAWVVSLAGPTPIRCLLETPDGKLVAGSVLEGLYILGKK